MSVFQCGTGLFLVVHVLFYILFFIFSLRISPVSISCSYLSQMLLFVYLLGSWVYASYCFGPHICMLVFLSCFHHLCVSPMYRYRL